MRVPNSQRPITPLRQRMIEDMTIRNLSTTTQASYIHWVKSFALYIGRSPDQATIEDVRAFQLHLVRRKIAWATLNQAVSGLRFFFGITLGRTDLSVRIPYARKAKTLPAVLGPILRAKGARSGACWRPLTTSPAGSRWRRCTRPACAPAKSARSASSTSRPSAS